MNTQLIQGLKIQWNRVDTNSYVRQIDALKGISQLEFKRPVTFFVGENGSGKSTLLEAIAIAYGFNPEGGTKNYSFSTYDDFSDLYQAVTLSKSCIVNGDISSAPKVSIMLLLRKRSMHMEAECLRCFMRNLMEKVSLISWKVILQRIVCTCLTNRKRRCHRSGS